MRFCLSHCGRPKPAGRSRIRLGKNGFTLLEVIASLVLVGLLAAVFGMGLVAAMKSNDFSRANVQIAQKAQLAMARISRELLELTDIDEIGDTGAGDDPFMIYQRMDLSNNQATNRYGLHFAPGTNNLFLYTGLNPAIDSLNGSTTGNGDILIDNVNNFTLDFFQGDGGWLVGSDFALLSTIEVNLSLNRPDDPSATQEFSARIHLRNTRNFGGAAPNARPASRDDYSCFIQTMFGNPPICITGFGDDE